MLLPATYEKPLSHTLTDAVLPSFVIFSRCDGLIMTFQFNFNCVSYYYIVPESYTLFIYLFIYGRVRS